MLEMRQVPLAYGCYQSLRPPTHWLTELIRDWLSITTDCNSLLEIIRIYGFTVTNPGSINGAIDNGHEYTPSVIVHVRVQSDTFSRATASAEHHQGPIHGSNMNSHRFSPSRQFSLRLGCFVYAIRPPQTLIAELSANSRCFQHPKNKDQKPPLLTRQHNKDGLSNGPSNGPDT